VNIFHRDLKSANIFLARDGTAKLGDMNVSKVAKKGLLYTQTGTPYYASPEVWRDQPYDHKSDIWSLGCVIYEAITLKPPFRAEDMQGLYKKVLKGIYPKIPSLFSSDLSALVKFLIQVPPKMRPDCDQILELPIVVDKIQQLFPEDFFFDSDDKKFNLLSTIRVPKNLLYLTDKLPKPNYETEGGVTQRDAQEAVKRKTLNG
jgi:NIMA (never in mitosis gene a)-related kinase